MDLEKDYECYLKANLVAYRDQWIAMVDGEIVSSGKNAKRVYEEARARFPKRRPLLARVPGLQTMIL
ncbi:MAG: succinyl-CoA synthetase subunit alpha [Candidatus Aenigmarchaeota archaeon]|nr:succinyl-CoA synthetase subunit alpha [Candidatus Aenigmarchaeota archaeon]